MWPCSVVGYRKRNPSMTSKTTAALTLADLCERYVKHLEDAGKSTGTVFSYTAELKLACTELGRDTLIASVTPELVQVFYDCDRVTKLRSGRPKAPASIAKSRRVLRLALWIDKVPLPASDATQ